MEDKKAQIKSQDKVRDKEKLTQLRNDLLYADVALVHQVSHSVEAVTEWLLCFF